MSTKSENSVVQYQKERIQKLIKEIENDFARLGQAPNLLDKMNSRHAIEQKIEYLEMKTKQYDANNTDEEELIDDYIDDSFEEQTEPSKVLPTSIDPLTENGICSVTKMEYFENVGSNQPVSQELDFNNEMARLEYLRKTKELFQNSVVNVYSSETSTCGNNIWTYKTTYCDVISIVTTTKPFRNATMKDLKLRNKEMRRIKAPHKPGPVASLEAMIANGKLNDKNKVNELLRTERNLFFNRLKQTRQVRTTTENLASIIIQTCFRGYFIRSRAKEIISRYQIHKKIRAKVKAALAESNSGLIVGLRDHRMNYNHMRFSSASVIQRAFRCWLSRRTLRRRFKESQLRRRNWAIVAMQKWIRIIIAQRKTRYLRSRRLLTRRTAGAVKLQTWIRRLLAQRFVLRLRYKIRWVAARMIQTAYRIRHSVWRIELLRALRRSVRELTGAREIQKIVRAFTARRRVRRIRLRKIYCLLFRYLSAIQRVVRGFLGRVRARYFAVKKKEEKAAALVLEAQLAKDAQVAEANNLLADMNIFLQFSMGNFRIVLDLISAAEGDPVEANLADSQGNTLLILSAAQGNLDIVRQCILWGTNIEHRNNVDENALIVSVKNGKLEVVSYLLSQLTINTSSATDGAVEGASVTTSVSSEDMSICLCLAACLGDQSLSVQLLTALTAHSFDVRARHDNTGDISIPTPLHAACKAGNQQAFKHLSMLLGPTLVAEAQITDSIFGQNALHKACEGQLAIFQQLLDLLTQSPEEAVPVPEGEGDQNPQAIKMLKLMTVLKQVKNQSSVHDLATSLCPSGRLSFSLLPQPQDMDGRNCLILAAKAGNWPLLQFLTDLVGSVSDKALDSGLPWVPTPSDIETIVSLPAATATEVSKLRLTTDNGIASCLQFLLSMGFDVNAVVVSSGQTMAMRAAQYGCTAVLDVLLNSDADLAKTDSRRRNVLHYAAMCKKQDANIFPFLLMHPKASSCSCTSMLLASADMEGLTPVHISAAEDMVLTIDLVARAGLDAALIERENSNGLTPLMYACYCGKYNSMHNLIKLGADVQAVDRTGRNSIWYLFHQKDCATIRPIASESDIHRTSCTSAEADAVRGRVKAEVSVVQTLLEAGCQLFTPSRDETIEEVLAKKAYSVDNYSVSAADMEPADIAANELSFSLFLAFPKFLEARECWRTVLSSIKYDDGTCRALKSLFGGNVVDKLVSLSGSVPPGASSVQALGKVFFRGTSLLGWMIKFNHLSAIKELVKLGGAIDGPIDTEGNSALHLAVRYGSEKMVEYIVDLLNQQPSRLLRFEMLNIYGRTAAMEGMLAGDLSDFHAVKKLIKLGADPRRALRGKYYAWVLALARKKESREVNTQTGRIGDDDERYFPVKLDPNFVFWFDDTAANDLNS